MHCRHCQRARVSRPRGLCWVCYYTPGIRDCYPSTSKFARHGIADKMGSTPLPPSPTDAPPGSEEKIQALIQRAQLQQTLFHPDDATAAQVIPRLPVVSLGVA